MHKTSLSKAQITPKENIEKRFHGSLLQPHCQKHKKGVLLTHGFLGKTPKKT
jgi:hypothetical protein